MAVFDIFRIGRHNRLFCQRRVSSSSEEGGVTEPKKKGRQASQHSRPLASIIALLSLAMLKKSHSVVVAQSAGFPEGRDVVRSLWKVSLDELKPSAPLCGSHY